MFDFGIHVSRMMYVKMHRKCNLPDLTKLDGDLHCNWGMKLLVLMV